MKKIGFSLVIFLVYFTGQAQFPPPAGQEGTTAIYKDSAVFVDWAKTCTVQRGYMDISKPDSGMVSAGEESFALGLADNTIVSLGDEGSAVLTFSKPIQNGPGPDFAVFENAFADEFLELAFVEVSSNGTDYIRMPSISLTQTSEQIGPFGLLDATNIHNLAGKYRALYGVPFDLEDIGPTDNFDEYLVTHVRIISLSGSINSTYASYDSEGNMINDPWPTMFASGGFDLDAVGVINNSSNSIRTTKENNLVNIFPNPVEDHLHINFFTEVVPEYYSIIDIHCQQLLSDRLNDSNTTIIDIKIFPSGIYFIRLDYKDSFTIHKFIKK